MLGLCLLVLLSTPLLHYIADDSEVLVALYSQCSLVPRLFTSFVGKKKKLLDYKFYFSEFYAVGFVATIIILID